MIISIAPGRTCLFGDHQDYLGLPIIACAIDRYIRLTAIENGLILFDIKMPDIKKQRIINIEEEIVYLDKNDHILSSLRVLRRYGCIPDKGYDITITGNLPINAGVSSSSAVVVAWVNFLLKAFGANKPITQELVGQIAYEAEVLEHNSPGGKMDQYSIGLGNILYLETGSHFSYEVFRKPLPGLIIGESGVPKETIGLLQELRENTWSAIYKVMDEIKDFDIKMAKIEDLETYLKFVPENLHSYLIAAINNHEITKKALLEFKKPILDIKKIGDLMNAHHDVLKNLLKITVPKIDDMIDASLEAGAYGAKIVGSGRGGSIAVIAPPDKEEAIIQNIKLAGGIDAYKVAVDPGARILKS